MSIIPKVGDKIRVTRNTYNSVRFTGLKTVKTVHWVNGDRFCVGVDADGGEGEWSILSSNCEVLPNPNSINSPDDLKSGMLVRVRGGGEYVVMKDFVAVNDNYDYSIVFVNKHGFLTMNGFDGFKYSADSCWDIVEVFKPDHVTTCVEAPKSGSTGWTSVWKEEVLTAEQLKIKELEETIRKATQEIEKLKAGAV